MQYPSYREDGRAVTDGLSLSLSLVPKAATFSPAFIPDLTFGFGEGQLVSRGGTGSSGAAFSDPGKDRVNWVS